LNFKEKLFLFLSGIFLTSMIMGNIIGVTKFVEIFGLTIPIGTLAFPVTFLATDLICELYGEKRAQNLVIVGFFMNFFMLAVMSLGNYLDDAGISGGTIIYDEVYGFMRAGVIASVIAYAVAQTVDVKMFHFWKRVTNGKHLWLRNNLSTTFSQLVDTIAILSINYMVGNFEGEINSLEALFSLILSMYTFKFFSALFDTPLFYLGVRLLKDKVNPDPE
jgi:queuosine precursor transporter|tara:strand:- start:1362 stop:2018 length:657 start_codon:yes stop_codon:yes gene_type:complete